MAHSAADIFAASRDGMCQNLSKAQQMQQDLAKICY
jgi:hypothetical protein